MQNFYKLINNQLQLGPTSLTIDEILILDPTESQYLVQGWKPLFIAERPSPNQYYRAYPIYIEGIDKIYQNWEERLEQTVDRIKTIKLRDLKKYDSSNEVNSFSINGVNMWLNKNDRSSLMYSIESEEALGLTATTIYTATVPSISLQMPINMSKQFLYSLEVYAKEAYGITQNHQNNITQLTTATDIINYDFTANYPTKLIFTI